MRISGVQCNLILEFVMSNVASVGGSGNVGGVGSLGTCTSVNFTFAKLQMELASAAKNSALGYIKQVENAQKDA